MILDKFLRLSEAQAVTGTTPVVSQNTLDLGNVAPKRDLGTGERMVALVHVGVALAGTSPTFLAELISSASADLSSPTVLGSTGTISGAANAPAGAQFEIPIPSGRIAQRYLGLRYTLGGTSPTVTVSAEIQPARLASQAIPQNYAKGYVA
jgi:hypothetical protein